jgi:hypothetical protein
MVNSLAITKTWIRDFIIKENICPFAKSPFEDNRILFQQCSELSDKILSNFLVDFFLPENNKYETSFLILEKSLPFDLFLEYYYILDEILKENITFSDSKLVVFHPDFVHDGDLDECVNYTNRSPFPMIQIIRPSELLDSIDQESVNEILQRNEAKLKTMSIHHLEKYRQDDDK